MRQFLEDTTGLSIYPIISFLIFLAFSLGVLVWMYTRRKGYYLEMKNLPLTEDDDTPATLK